MRVERASIERVVALARHGTERNGTVQHLMKHTVKPESVLETLPEEENKTQKYEEQLLAEKGNISFLSQDRVGGGEGGGAEEEDDDENCGKVVV